MQVFVHYRDPHPHVLTGPDGHPLDLCDSLERIPWFVTRDKFAAALFGPYRLRGNRANVNVTEVTHAVLDFDHARPADVATILRRFAGVRMVAYSTFSNGENGEARFRVVCPLAQPISAARWAETWRGLRRANPELDEHCSDVSRASFLPSCAPGRAPWRVSWPGPGLDVDALAPTPEAEAHAAAHTPPLPPEILERLIRKWGRSTDVLLLALGDALARARDGLVFATEGNRNDTAFRLVAGLVTETKNARPETIAATLARSCHLQGGPSWSEVVGMARRAQRAARDVVESPTDLTAEGRISSAELAELFRTLGTTDPVRSLILQRDSDYWILSHSPKDGCQYVPVSRGGLVKQAADKLERFGVSTFTVGDKPRKMTPEELTERYGSPVESVLKSWECSHPEIRRDGAFRELVLPGARKRSVVARYDVRVEYWLRLLGGSQAEKLLDWIVLAQNTSRPLAALVSIGVKGTGKSLIGKELARLWTRHSPPTLERCLASHNDDLERCPIVLADEDLPRDFRGRVRSAEIREFVQRGRHAINPKFKGITHLEGFPRLVAAANNDTILEMANEALTAADLEAVQARLFVLRPAAAAADFLAKQDVQAWIEQDIITGFFVWLRENRSAVYRGRFGVAGDDFGRGFLSSGLRSLVVEWIVKLLLQPERCRTTAETRDGVFRIRMSDLDGNWAAYLGSAKPKTSAIANAVAVFAGGGDGWVAVPYADLAAWVQNHNYASISEFTEAFVNFGKERRLSVVK